MAFGTDVSHACRVAERAVKALDDVFPEPPPAARAFEFAESSINSAVMAWHRPEAASMWVVRNDMIEAVLAAYADEGIEIPFARRVIEWLPGAPPPVPTRRRAALTKPVEQTGCGHEMCPTWAHLMLTTVGPGRECAGWASGSPTLARMARPSRPARSHKAQAPMPGDVLDPLNDPDAAGPPQRSVAPTDEVVHRATGARGTVDKWHRDWVVLRLRGGSTRRVTNLAGGFSVDGETITLTGLDRSRPAAAAPLQTASGSIAALDGRAKVARASRLWVEGDHDARLLERVWGDDLRDAAIVVEPQGGIDDLDEAVARFAPGPQARLAVLVDHLVPGTKEWHLTENQRGPLAPHVTVVGHPYVDVWQCVRPQAVGIGAWPEVPKGEDWKTGICRRLGWGTPQDGWRRILASVNSFSDLDPTLVGAVETALDALLGDGAGPT